jgi:trigger factor
MQFSLTTTKGLERRLEVTVPPEQVATEVNGRLKALARTARMKGFRPGKVPFAVVRQQYGGQAHAEAVDELIRSTYSEALNREQLRPAGDPRIEPLQVAPGGILRYAATFEILPEIKLGDLGAISVERPTAEVTDADVAAMLESMRKQKPVFAHVERPAQATDRVTIEFEGRIDGELFPGGKGDDLRVILGAGSILPELDAALHGTVVGEEKTAPARFPDDYGAKTVAGKLAEFRMKVLSIESQALPQLDEEFIRGFGMHEGGIDEFRAQVRSSMETEIAGAVRNKLREQLLDALYKATPLELPQVMLEEQIRELQVQVLRRAGVQKIERAEQLPPRDPFVEPAAKRVALGLIIGEIIRANAIRVDRARVEQRLDSVTAAYPDPEGVRRQYLQSREAMAQLESAALEDQALDWVQGQAKVIDKPTTFTELTGFGKQQGDSDDA